MYRTNRLTFVVRVQGLPQAGGKFLRLGGYRHPLRLSLKAGMGLPSQR